MGGQTLKGIEHSLRSLDVYLLAKREYLQKTSDKELLSKIYEEFFKCND